jgi:hypothetical protein
MHKMDFSFSPGDRYKCVIGHFSLVIRRSVNEFSFS